MIPGLAGLQDEDQDSYLKWTGGSIGEQMGAPRMPAAPPPVPPLAPPPAPPPADDVLPPDAASLPAPPPQVEPYKLQPVMPIPASRTVTPAEASNLGAMDANTRARAETMQQGGELSRQKAEETAINADANAEASNNYLAEREKIAADAQKSIAQRQKQADQDYQAYRDFGIKDPQASQSFGHRLMAGIAVGLGAYSQGIQGGQNNALAIIQKTNADNIALQKAQQDKLFRMAERSGEGVELARRERDDAFKQLDLKHAALLQSSADQLKAHLARIGVPEAQIAANTDIQKLEAESLQLRERTLRSIANDETSLARADITAAAKRARAAAGGGGGGAPGAMQQLSQHLVDNPGDVPGAFALAEKLGLKGNAAQKAVDEAAKLTKGTESQAKDASQGAVALRAIDSIEKLGYTPSREDVQKWMGNQRDVARAQQMSEGKGIGGALSGGLANLAQKRGILAQNEFDGLGDKAKEYFTNVRRYMETIGRVQSGAAISNGEWSNFYGQYGPQSKDGLEGARQFAKDRFRLSGVAGRQLSASGSAPSGEKRGAAPAASAPKSKRELVQEALDDPDAPPAVKARALQLKRSMGW